MNVSFGLRIGYFDKIKVQRELDRRTAKALKRFGAFVRRSAQQSMRKAKDGVYSRPGQPPFSHGQQRFKKGILFAYEPATKTVVIGPRLYERSARFKIPRLHEFGATDPRGVFEQRPLMKPAFMKELSHFNTFFVE